MELVKCQTHIAGQWVNAASGEELGGKSPNIVFDDADIDNAVKGVVSGIFAATATEVPNPFVQR